MKKEDYLPSLGKKTIKKLTLKLFSSRLNIKSYNKLSKEVEDFRDL